MNVSIRIYTINGNRGIQLIISFSLTNVNYKIAPKVIANRVKSAISTIIHNSQTGFIKGRYIGENIRLFFEILDNAEDEDKPGLIFFSDFEKAFDSADHTFIISCL